MLPRASALRQTMHFRNRLLAALPRDELDRLLPALEPVSLASHAVLFAPWQPIPHVHFPHDAMVSVLSVVADGPAVESAVVGCDGMAGMPRFHGVPSAPELGIVQVGGAAHRIEADAFAALLPELPSLEAALHRYAAALFTMAAQASACNRRHSIERRCARWLLMVQDRVGRDRFAVTQQFLAQMLGVRRATVSVAAALLQRQGLIRYSRGRITILRRAELEGAACGCYGVIEQTFARLLGPTVVDEAADD